MNFFFDVRGPGFLGLAHVLDEPWPSPIAEAWLVWGYSIFFGGVVAAVQMSAVLNLQWKAPVVFRIESRTCERPGQQTQLIRMCQI